MLLQDIEYPFAYLSWNLEDTMLREFPALMLVSVPPFEAVPSFASAAELVMNCVLLDFCDGAGHNRHFDFITLDVVRYCVYLFC